MKRWLALLVLTLLPAVLCAQYVITPSVWIEPGVLARLNKDWTETPGQNERGYCIRFVVNAFESAKRLPQFTVVDAWRAKEVNPSPQGMDDLAGCPVAPDITWMHTHPPHTNLDDVYEADGVRKPNTFVRGGIEAYQCQPSDADYTSFMFQTQFPFELIMCARNAIVPYYRKPYKIIPPKV